LECLGGAGGLQHLLERLLQGQRLPDLLHRRLGVGENEVARLHRAGLEPVLDGGGLDARVFLGVPPGRVEVLPDRRGGEVVDVVIPRSVEAAAEHEPLAAIQLHEPRFVQGADLVDGRLGKRVVDVLRQDLAQRVFVSRDDIRDDADGNVYVTDAHQAIIWRVGKRAARQRPG
jgi:hypothetical protein